VRRRRHPRAGGTSAIASDTGRRGAVQPAAGRSARRLITWPALAMMTVGSVGYLGSAPATAVLGLASVFLYVLPAFVFLVPVSLVAAELASGWPDGVYNWVREGISAPMGLPRSGTYRTTIRRLSHPYAQCSLNLGLSDALAAKSNGLSRRRKRAMIDPFLDDYSLRP
jgi:hypothetical protein